MMWALLLGLCLGVVPLPLSPTPLQELSARSGPLRYAPTIKGEVAGFRLAGIEPDGDPLNQVVLRTTLSGASNVPPTRLVVNSYLENFKPDTTPILPDLLHPTRTARNLGGFLQGKALLTDDAGDILYVGSFLAEAFLDNSNHAVMDLDGSGLARGGTARLKGTFRLRKDGSLSGNLTGILSLPPPARRQILQHRGMKMKPLEQILNTVTVRPAPMRGKATKGSTNLPLHTGYGPRPVPSSPSRRPSIWTIVTGVGAVLCFILAAVLFWSSRRRET